MAPETTTTSAPIVDSKETLLKGYLEEALYQVDSMKVVTTSPRELALVRTKIEEALLWLTRVI